MVVVSLNGQLAPNKKYVSIVGGRGNCWPHAATPAPIIIWWRDDRIGPSAMIGLGSGFSQKMGKWTTCTTTIAIDISRRWCSFTRGRQHHPSSPIIVGLPGKQWADIIECMTFVGSHTLYVRAFIKYSSVPIVFASRPNMDKSPRTENDRSTTTNRRWLCAQGDDVDDCHGGWRSVDG